MISPDLSGLQEFSAATASLDAACDLVRVCTCIRGVTALQAAGGESARSALRINLIYGTAAHEYAWP